MTWLWVGLQIFLGAEWGQLPSSGWQLYGAELRKTSAIASPRAYILLLNGADARGLPYQTEDSRFQTWTDSAVSPCIDLSQVQGPVYALFAYQRGGLMDSPESDDTLRLWGLSSDGVWEPLWYAVGGWQGDTSFTRVVLPLTDTRWKHHCFRLRWSAWGSAYGPYDNWHIAYTYVKGDTALPTVFWQAIPRVYGGLYGTWPPGKALSDSLIACIVGGWPGTVMEVALLQSGQPIATWSGALTADTAQIELLAPRPQQAGIYALSWSVSAFGQDTVLIGDSFSLEGATWSYEDGEMETGYGLRQANRPFCQRFFLDTIVRISRVGVRFFPLPTQYGKPFQLGVWRPSEGLTPLYLKYERVVVDSVSGWVWYPIDTSLVVSGEVCVGFMQADDQPLGVGWDASGGSGFVQYASGGEWVPSQVRGCMMLRIETASPATGIATAQHAAENRPAVLQVGQKVSVSAALLPIEVWDAVGRRVAIWRESVEAPAAPGVYLCRDRTGYTWRLLVFP
ncbi:MAG: hypothetical protein N3A68_01690 [Bacteroidia bacterium]|jgi:hypothetical protein|nr:hypothetical protein [Bacteroidia bacterium]GIV23352.1 MAG: hypothetical protein KatS3mg025_1011 [Bacteroidia bacterium]